MEPNPGDFPVLPTQQPIALYVPQETNGQAAAPPVAEGISAGELLVTTFKASSNHNQTKSPSTTVKSGSGVYKHKRKSAMLTSSSSP